MCGLTGFLDPTHLIKSDEFENVISKMTRTLVHRGPDDFGVWVDKKEGIAFGHQRLSILDLSKNGHQPMHSDCGRYSLIYNGELYNYSDIRSELEELRGAPEWVSHSDTEVILASISHWGLEKALKRFVGMFAFTLWDKRDHVLHLVRDRLGEKPLYYGWLENIFLFGSELKAFRAHPFWKGEINHDMVALFLKYSYVPAPFAIYKNFFKLLPGTYLSISSKKILAHGKSSSSFPLTPKVYWSARNTAETGAKNLVCHDEIEARNHLDTLLRQSIKQQLVADVPVGAFLSGGIDSSTIVSLAQAESSNPVKTFTIGFEDEMFDEAKYAKAVARYLGTDHTELYVTAKDAQGVIPEMPRVYDEPFSDISQIPTLLIAKLARQDVTVSLSGDGGDEIFAGYNRHLWGPRIFKKTQYVPGWMRKGISREITRLSPSAWNTIYKNLDRLIPKRFKQKNAGEKIHKIAELIKSNNMGEFYDKLASHWQLGASPALTWKSVSIPSSEPSQRANLSGFTEQMMYLDMISYLPDDIMVKVDRATMAASLESRAPYLDHRVVEYAWSLPTSFKIKSGQGKWLLRQVLYKYVPLELVERPKMGFAPPIGLWLKESLRDWAESLLDEKKLAEGQYLNPISIREKWAEHLSGRGNWQHHLWDVLMFQAWKESQN